MMRRQFFTAFALSGALWTAWQSWTRARLPSRRSAAGADRLVAVLGQPGSAAAVGRAYLTRHPDEADRDRLAAQLAAGLRSRGCDPARSDTARLRASLARQLRADFGHSRVVRVDGWVLSLTEARLCALAALTVA
ncbi:MAG TPA: hypothetical protein VLE23_08300 [Geminicoccaceae bacterium]|nr:hypothetical protein [Geminicoccaceae bacterium]